MVSLFYRTLFGVSLLPSSSYTAMESVAMVLYALVPPMFNPFVYTLRNKEVTGAMRRLVKKYLWSP